MIMEMKRALTWYFVILVALAAGLYLFLELFVNQPESPGIEAEGTESAAPETVETTVPAAETPADASGELISENIPPLPPGEAGDSGQVSASASAAGTGSGNVSPPPSPPSVTGSSGGNYTVQVAAFSSREKAAGVVEQLNNDGFPGGWIASDMGDEFNRVWIGSFASRAEALAFAEKLKGKGYNTYVRTVR